MPIRDRVVWGRKNPFSDRRLQNFEKLVRDFRMRRKPPHWAGDKAWENRWHDLPAKPPGYYREFYVGTSVESSSGTSTDFCSSNVSLADIS